jgi:hypothetical protein
MASDAKTTIHVPSPGAAILTHIEDCIRKAEAEFGPDPMDQVALDWLARVREACQ